MRLLRIPLLCLLLLVLVSAPPTVRAGCDDLPSRARLNWARVVANPDTIDVWMSVGQPSITIFRVALYRPSDCFFYGEYIGPLTSVVRMANVHKLYNQQVIVSVGYPDTALFWNVYIAEPTAAFHTAYFPFVRVP